MLYYRWGFPGGTNDKEPSYQCRLDIRDVGSILGLGRSPGDGNSSPLQYSCLENPHGQKSLAGYGPWGRKKSDTTKATNHTHSTEYSQKLNTYLMTLIKIDSCLV